MGRTNKGAPIGFIYDINYKTFNPLLVYSDQESFHALGIAYLIETGDYCLNKQIAEAMKGYIVMHCRIIYPSIHLWKT